MFRSLLEQFIYWSISLKYSHFHSALGCSFRTMVATTTTTLHLHIGFWMRISVWNYPTSTSSFHLTATVVLPHLCRVVVFFFWSSTKVAIGSDKMPSFSQSASQSRLPGLPLHPASQAAVCPAKHAGSPNLDGGRCYGWLIHQASRGKAKWGPVCWQEKYNNPAALENQWLLDEWKAILKPNVCLNCTVVSPSLSPHSSSFEILFLLHFSSGA